MGLPRIFSVLALSGAASLCAKMAVADPAAESRATAPQGLAAYRAVYELSLSDSGLAAGGAGGRGRLSFDLSGSSCQGYQEIRHQVTELQTAGGAPQLLDSARPPSKPRTAMDSTSISKSKAGRGGAEKRERKGEEDERVRFGGDARIGQRPRRRSRRRRLVPRGISATNARGRA